MEKRGVRHERRKHKRIKEEHTIAVKVIPEGDGRSVADSMFFHLANDFSKGGLRFQNAGFIPANTRLKIFIALKDPLKTVTYTGVVRWVKRLSETGPFSIGVEFTAASEGSAEAWDKYLSGKL